LSNFFRYAAETRQTACCRAGLVEYWSICTDFATNAPGQVGWRMFASRAADLLLLQFARREAA
jgi:hypothetical protein